LLPEPGPLPAGGLEEVYDTGDRAVLRAGFVLSVDGGISVDGQAGGLHTPSDNAVFHALRSVADAVLVGAGTARRENYGPVVIRPHGAKWRRAHARSAAVPLVVVSRRLDLDPAARCFSAGRAIVLTCESSPEENRRALEQVADVLVCGDDEVDLPKAVTALHDRGLPRLLCEGGPTLLGELQAAGLVDELCLTVSPHLVGLAPGLLPTQLAAPVPLILRSVVDGEDGALLCRWEVGRA
jgi:5-amino-6-(5-phosphoribosylamino)uracil reductase